MGAEAYGTERHDGPAIFIKNGGGGRAHTLNEITFVDGVAVSTSLIDPGKVAVETGFGIPAKLVEALLEFTGGQARVRCQAATQGSNVHGQTLSDIHVNSDGGVTIRPGYQHYPF